MKSNRILRHTVSNFRWKERERNVRNAQTRGYYVSCHKMYTVFCNYRSSENRYCPCVVNYIATRYLPKITCFTTKQSNIHSAFPELDAAQNLCTMRWPKTYLTYSTDTAQNKSCFSWKSLTIFMNNVIREQLKTNNERFMVDTFEHGFFDGDHHFLR